MKEPLQYNASGVKQEGWKIGFGQREKAMYNGLRHYCLGVCGAAQQDCNQKSNKVRSAF